MTLASPPDSYFWLPSLSGPRFYRYMLWADHSEQKALELYMFNLLVGQSWYCLLHDVEILLKNKINQYFITKFGPEWYLNETVIRPIQIQAVEHVITKHACAGMPDKIISELSFGFWNSLFNSPHAHLWNSYGLYTIFHQKNLRRQNIAQTLHNLRLLRNRIAHYEPVIQLPLTDLYQSAVSLCKLLEPAYQPNEPFFITQHQRISINKVQLYVPSTW